LLRISHHQMQLLVIAVSFEVQAESRESSCYLFVQPSL